MSSSAMPPITSIGLLIRFNLKCAMSVFLWVAAQVGVQRFGE